MDDQPPPKGKAFPRTPTRAKFTFLFWAPPPSPHPAVAPQHQFQKILPLSSSLSQPPCAPGKWSTSQPDHW